MPYIEKDLRLRRGDKDERGKLSIPRSPCTMYDNKSKVVGVKCVILLI